MNEKLINDTKKTKKCSKCGKELPISEFSKNKTTKDGLYSWCKQCYNGYKQANKEHISQQQKQYRATNSQHLNQYNREYRNQFKGYYLYIILDKQDNVAYIGQTTNYYTRLINHLSGGVNSTKELFSSGNWGIIKYLDVSDLVANEAELKALENALIELYEPRCNTKLNIIRDIDKGRLFSLIATLHSMLNTWEEFRTNNN